LLPFGHETTKKNWRGADARAVPFAVAARRTNGPWFRGQYLAKRKTPTANLGPFITSFAVSKAMNWKNATIQHCFCDLLF
jgi:hypothetical protein